MEWKKILLYAIAPAIIAGLFSVAPKLYDIFMEPKAELTYSTVTGPELQNQTGAQKIIAITVSNSGKRSLSNVTASLTVEGGKIEAQTIHEYSGLKTSPLVTDHEVSLTLPKLHPSEKFSLSALLVKNGPDIPSRFTLRSDEVLGKPAEVKDEKKESWLPQIVSVLGVVVSVFGMAVGFLTKKGSIGGSSGSFKIDALYYIPVRVGLPEIAKEMRLTVTDLTYRRMADIFLSYGLEGDVITKTKATLALKCMLLFNNIANDSRQLIVENLRVLQGSEFNEADIAEIEQTGKKITDYLSFRKGIDEIVGKAV